MICAWLSRLQILTHYDGRYTILQSPPNQDCAARGLLIAMKGNGYSITPSERISLSVLVYGVVALSLLLWQFGQSISIYAVIIGYSVFVILLRIFAAVDHKRPKTDVVPAFATLPSVSIMAAAHDEESVIADLVHMIGRIDYPDLQVLIVDDRSSDRTAEILRALKEANEVNFEFYSRAKDSKPGKAAVLNEALPKLRGEVILFFDADGRVEPDFLRKTVPYLADPKVGAVQTRKVPNNADYNFLTRCQGYEFALDGYMQTKRDTLVGAVELRGNGMLVRKKTLEELGGFAEYNLTEDLDLCTRMHLAGWDLRYASDVKIMEEAMPSVRLLYKQRLRWTEGSLIRYLDHAGELMMSKKISFRTKLDMMQFVFECILPVWLVAENCVLLYRYFSGTLTTLPVLYGALAAGVLSVYFWLVAFQGVGRFENQSIWGSFVGAASVYFYLTTLWIPIVLHVVFGILTRKERNLVFVKTQRFGSKPR
jgi:1,2-diacylglycerol 3-beta-glucosyltransferase